MLAIYLVLPESPAWAVSRDKPEKAKKSMRFIYRGVAGYNVDTQYEVLASTIAHERAVAEENRSIKWYSIFKGVNGVSYTEVLETRYQADRYQRRTIVSTWALTSQQVLGLTLVGYHPASQEEV